jgi:hypothetical protein
MTHSGQSWIILVAGGRYIILTMVVDDNRQQLVNAGAIPVLVSLKMSTFNITVQQALSNIG